MHLERCVNWQIILSTVLKDSKATSNLVVIFCFFPLFRGRSWCGCSFRHDGRKSGSHQKPTEKSQPRKQGEYRLKRLNKQLKNDVLVSIFVFSITGCCPVILCQVRLLLLRSFQGRRQVCPSLRRQESLPTPASQQRVGHESCRQVKHISREWNLHS